MRSVMLILAVTALAWNVAPAQENDLSNGVFIFHHDPAIVWSDFPPAAGWCDTYLAENPITTCEGQNPSITVTDHVLWFVLAAWNEPKHWCLSEFGFGEYNGNSFVFLTSGACAAEGDYLEISTGQWPGPMSGTAVTRVNATFWAGNFVPVYYFAGYAYSAASIPMIDDPTGTPFAGFITCDTPPVAYETTCKPSMGILQAGETCCPPAPGEEGACCFEFGDSCQVVLATDCTSLGGDFQGAGTDCDPNPCPVVWACCDNAGLCQMLTVEDCGIIGGEFQGPGVDCSPNPCAQPAACCFDNDCSMMLEDACIDQGGVFQGQGTDCEPNPCPVVWACCSENLCTMTTFEDCNVHPPDQGPYRTWFEGWECDQINCLTPVEKFSWGRIKSIYR